MCRAVGGALHSHYAIVHTPQKSASSLSEKNSSIFRATTFKILSFSSPHLDFEEIKSLKQVEDNYNYNANDIFSGI